MIGHLVRAQLWRMRWTFLMVAAIGAVVVSQSNPMGRRVTLAMALMMAVGSLTTLGLFWSREVRTLPIRPEAALRSAWCVAMLMPAAILLGRLAVVFGFAVVGSSAPLTAEAVAIIAVFDAVYVGTSLLFLQLENEPWYGFPSLRKLFSALWIAAYLPFMALPFAWPELVPRALSDVRLFHVAIVFAGLAATLWPVIVSPSRWPTLGVILDAPRQATVVRPLPKRTDYWLDRLHGISRLLPGPLIGAAVVALLSLGTFAVFSSRLRGGVRSPFDAGLRELEFLFVGGPMVMMLLASVGVGHALTPFLRHLKVLPIDTRRLILILTSLPLITPLMYWMFAAAMHAIVAPPGPPAWRPGILLFLCGVLALGSALVTRFNSAAAGLGNVLPLIGLIMLMEIIDKNQIEPVLAMLLPAVGAAALSAALYLNYHTLTHASSQASAYRNPAAAHAAR